MTGSVFSRCRYAWALPYRIEIFRLRLSEPDLSSEQDALAPFSPPIAHQCTLGLKDAVRGYSHGDGIGRDRVGHSLGRMWLRKAACDIRNRDLVTTSHA